MERFLESLKKLLEVISAVVLLFMFVGVIITVVCRELFKIPVAWSEDLIQLSFILMTFIGSAAIMKDESHIKVTILMDYLSEGLQKVFRIIGRLLMISFFVMFVIGAYQNMQFNWIVGFPTASWVKIGYMYLVLFISGIISIFYLCVNIYYDIFSKKHCSFESRR